MISNPPPYAPPPEESKGLYPSVPADPYQQPPQAGGYYTQQPAPAGYSGYYPPPQQQPQQFTVTTAPAAVVVAPQPPVQSYIVHIVLACFVTFCCGLLCGIIAFIFAMVAYSRAAYNPQSARQMGILSIVFSVLGIAVMVILVVLVIVLYLIGTLAFVNCAYSVNGICYSSRVWMFDENKCYDGLWQSGYCYRDY